MKQFIKNAIVLSSLLFCASAPFGAKAQNMSGYKNLEVLVGANIPYFTPNLSVTYDKERSTKLTYGIGLISQYNSDKLYKEATKDVGSKLIVAAGLHLRYRFLETRNFTAALQLGAYLGDMNNNYIYFPSLKLKESFFIAPKTKLVLAQNVVYYFQKNKGLQEYDPQLQLGLCFMF